MGSVLMPVQAEVDEAGGGLTSSPILHVLFVTLDEAFISKPGPSLEWDWYPGPGMTTVASSLIPPLLTCLTTMVLQLSLTSKTL